jgi:predicted DCC family thiol-disulfide oxidoreductase YuxK
MVSPTSAAPAAVLYDIDCGFCRWACAVFLRWDRHGALRPVAIQDAEGQRLLADLGETERLDSWHLVLADGTRTSAGEALSRIMPLLPAGRGPGLLLRSLGPVTRWGYGQIASHREIPGRRLSQTQIDNATALIRERSAPDSLIQDDSVAASCSIAAPRSRAVA